MRRPLQIVGLVIFGLTPDASAATAQTAPAPAPISAGAAVPILGGGLAPGQDGLPTKDGVASGPPTYIRRERLNCTDFSRKPDATWTAIRAVALPAPEGLLKVESGAIYRIGQFYGGYDLAAMLEHDCPKG